MDRLPQALQDHLQSGFVIPAHPLALTPQRTLDWKHQQMLTRYYVAAGVGGIAVGVHTTQFELHDQGRLRIVLKLISETARNALINSSDPFLLVAGICGDTKQALREATQAYELGYHAGLLRFPTDPNLSENDLLIHARQVGEIMPLFGFYLQPAVGGRILSYQFWREFIEIPAVVAIKVAAFNRYQTLDVMRALWDSDRRNEVTLFTGNDDNILVDLLTEFSFGEGPPLIFKGGLLGQWAVWTKKAVELLHQIKLERDAGVIDVRNWLTKGARLTDANAAIFDARNAFRGCIPGIHEVLRQQGLLAGRWCMDPTLDLSPGQEEEIGRVLKSYPELNDNDFIAEHIQAWI